MQTGFAIQTLVICGEEIARKSETANIPELCFRLLYLLKTPNRKLSCQSNLSPEYLGVPPFCVATKAPSLQAKSRISFGFLSSR